MSFIIVLAVLMINSKNDALVDTDYYEKGLEYDKEYSLKEQVKTDKAAPLISLTDDHIQLAFKDQAEGHVQLIRTADKRMDKKLSMKTDSLKLVRIPLNNIEKGHWRLIISWMANDKAYLNEQEITVP